MVDVAGYVRSGVCGKGTVCMCVCVYQRKPQKTKVDVTLGKVRKSGGAVYLSSGAHSGEENGGEARGGREGIREEEGRGSEKEKGAGSEEEEERAGHAVTEEKKERERSEGVWRK